MVSLSFDYLFKTIIVGDPNVGKTSIALRFSTGTFRERYLFTIGVEFSVKDIEVDGNKVKIQAWDTGGHDKYSYIRPLYYKGSYGALIVYDITNKDSFENLDKWFKEVYDNCESTIPAILVGNKNDLEEQREVTREEALNYAEEMSKRYNLDNIPYFETSAKTGENVDDIYFELTRLMIKKSNM